jgi:activator of HSP90 ATPase
MSKLIRQSLTLKGTPEEIYKVLMDSRKHAKLTGARAKISREVGGTIAAYDGYIEGKNVELVRNKKIVQLWRGSDWPAGVFSRATFALHKVHGGTHIRFRQSGVPDTQYKAIKQGWIDFYWDPMRKLFGKV